MQQNLNHCELAQDLLMQTVVETKPDILLISEPYRKPESQHWVFDLSGKAAIWSCNSLPLQNTNGKTQRGFVRAKIGNIHFYSCYAPPSDDMKEFVDFLDRLIDDAKEHCPVAIAGDFNAWAVDWGSKETNTRGHALLEAFSNLDVVLLNTGRKWTFERGGKGSIVDLTFVSPGLVSTNNNAWEVTDTSHFSDHQLICWEVSTDCVRKVPPALKTNAVGWKTSVFNRELFRVVLQKGPINAEDATAEVEEVMKRVTIACDSTMPRKRQGNRHSAVHWWNDTIAALRQECIRTRRKAQRGRGKPNYTELERIHKDARRNLVKEIKSSKRICWQELLEEVDNDPWGRPYKVVMKKLKNQAMPSPTCPKMLEKIVSVLFPQRPSFDDQIEQNDETDIPAVTLQELKAACSKVGISKAPGLDGIPNIALKEAIEEAPEMFLSMYNRCLQEGTFPAKWKRQRLVLLPKGKKPSDEPSSYRPLCMLDTAGKVFERVIYGRIEEIAERHLSDNQFGLRKGRSTLNAINLVIGKAREAIAGERWKNGGKHYCLVVTLDIKNAFNSARWDRILEALSRMNVPGYLRKIVRSYFRDRILKYDTEDGPKEYHVTGGVPQGSVLGPLLWNIMYDGLLKLKAPRAVTPVAFADDIALTIVAKFLDEITHLFNVTFELYQKWMEGMGLELAKHKTEGVLITSRKTLETMTLKVGECLIDTQPSIRYLGVLIDSRLNFKAQVENASTKAAAVGKALSRLMPNVGGPKQKRRALLTSVTTSVMTYGIAIWADALTIHNTCKNMTAVHRQCALRVASAFRTVSKEAIEVISGLLPIEILAEERKRIFHRRETLQSNAKEGKKEAYWSLKNVLEA